MEAHHPGNGELERTLETRYRAQLDEEVMRLREQSRQAVEQFKRSFPPPTDDQIERLLYPELSEFTVELGGRRFVMRELPALAEKRFLRLLEQKLPQLLSEILSFDERLGDNAAGAFGGLLSRAGSALDLIAEACVLVLDPEAEAAITRDWVQQNASTSRQLRILRAQLLLNGARDFLSRLFPGWIPAEVSPNPTRVPPPPSVGSSSSVNPPETSPGASRLDS